MYENDGPLIRLARGASMRPSDPERKEQSCSGNAKSLLGDQVPCGSFGHPIVLDHRVPHFAVLRCRHRVGPGCCQPWAPLRTVRESFPSYGSSPSKASSSAGPVTG